jgi:hypothetical protein
VIDLLLKISVNIRTENINLNRLRHPWLRRLKIGATSANTLPALRPLYPCGARGSARCSARLTHIALACKPDLYLVSRVCLFGSRNVAGRCPLGDIMFCAGLTAARRPGGLHKTCVILFEQYISGKINSFHRNNA